MINRVTLIGNLGQDPEIRRLENGAAVAKFSVATNESYQDKTTGQWHDQTEWHTVVAWRYLAEKAERDLKKGKLVFIEGKLTHRKWQDKDGNNRYSTEVVAKVLRLMERKDSTGDNNYNSSPTTSSPATANTTPAAPVNNAGNEAADDDLPF